MIRTKRGFRAGWAALALVGLLAWMPQAAKAQQGQTAARTLKVKLKYSGAGTVDEKRQIFLFLFDSPDFMRSPEAAMPIDRQTTPSKDAAVTFSDVPKSPVYLVAVYDPTGAYEGMSAPPSGASIAFYAKAPNQPEPIRIDAGKTAEIELIMDDSAKMP